jgi:hypothetical protein
MEGKQKLVEALPPRTFPPAHRPLLEAHDRFLREAYAFLASTQEKLSGVGNVMVYVLFVRLLQHGRGLHLLLLAGYPEEAELIARAMTITATSLVAIVDGDADSRALQFVAHGSVQRRRKLNGYIRQDILEQKDANAWHVSVTDTEKKILREYADHGIVPLKIGKGHMFWHGMSETDLFRKMKLERWLDLFYGPFSEEVHGTVESCADAVRELVDGQLVRLGPTYNDPRMVVAASYETVGQALIQIEAHYRLGRRPEAEAIGKRMADALHDHAQRLDKGTKHRLMTEGTGEPAAARPGGAHTSVEPEKSQGDAG